MLNRPSSLTRRPERARLVEDSLISIVTSFNVIEVADVRDHLEITHNEDNNLLRQQRDTVLDWMQRVTGHRIQKQTRRAIYANPAQRFELPSRPIQSLDKVETSDEGSIDTLDDSKFYLQPGTPDEARPKRTYAWSYPITSVRFEYTAGYKSKEAVPQGVVEALKKMVADLYEYRTSLGQGTEIPDELATKWKDLIATYAVLSI